jgi:hypothetical protein
MAIFLSMRVPSLIQRWTEHGYVLPSTCRKVDAGGSCVWGKGFPSLAKKLVADSGNCSYPTDITDGVPSSR